MDKEVKSNDRDNSPKVPAATKPALPEAKAGTNQVAAFPLAVMQFDCGDCCKEAVYHCKFPVK